MASPFTSKLESKLTSFTFDTSNSPTGVVETVGDGVALVSGLPKVAMGEIVEIEGTYRALALNLTPDKVGCVLLHKSSRIGQGSLVNRTGQLLSVPVSDEFLGRVVNALGEPLDGQGPVEGNKLYPLEKVAPGVVARESVDTPLQTGLRAIDSMIPIGRGQRELIIGDRATGKSAVALTTIINQKDKDVICVYVAIGQKQSFVSQIVSTLEEFGALDHTIVVNASSSDPAAQLFIAPYAGTALAEYFLNQGKDVLIVYDDLTKHAWAYREISLLLRRPSGREAYPGDVFYLHSRLLERACKLNKEHGGGSITALPIIETQGNDVSAYIPTNVISITDGQIYLEADLFNSGQRPAINVGLSVSRVGSAAQVKAMKQVAGQLRLDLAQYRELAAFAQFSSDLDPQTKAQIDRGARVTKLLVQPWQQPQSTPQQVVLIWAATQGYLDQIKLDHIQDWQEAYLDLIVTKHKSILHEIETQKALTDKLTKKLESVTKAFNSELLEWKLDKDTEKDQAAG